MNFFKVLLCIVSTSGCVLAGVLLTTVNAVMYNVRYKEVNLLLIGFIYGTFRSYLELWPWLRTFYCSRISKFEDFTLVNS